MPGACAHLISVAGWGTNFPFLSFKPGKFRLDTVISIVNVKTNTMSRNKAAYHTVSMSSGRLFWPDFGSLLVVSA